MINSSPLKVKHLLKVLKHDSQRAVSNLKLTSTNDKQYCYDTLNKVSRSFALVIQDLPVDLKDAICIFYLVLRALDTIEDDMSLDNATKLDLLASFHEKCGDETFVLQGIGDKPEYVELLQNYPRVNRVYNELTTAYQDVIRDITQEMAEGMILFANKDVVTKEDYDLYCHYVAGIVGQGLSRIFVASGLEDEDYLEKMDISNAMGLFLQKTNITRDFHEDIDEGRIFWPEEIWQNYTKELTSLKTDFSHPRSIACLNKMVENALGHFGESITYLEGLKNEKIFRFCAIPQVMALGTLSEVCNNPLALKQNVKLDKKFTLAIFSNVHSMKDFAGYAIECIQQFQLAETDIALEVTLEKYKEQLSKYL